MSVPSARATAQALLFLAVSWPGVARAEEEKWLKVSTRHFTILTSAQATDAKQWAGRLEQFQWALQVVVPVPEEQLPPVIVMLFKNDRALEPYKPLEHGKPAHVAGYFVRTDEINAIALSLASDDAQTRHVIFHEAVHWHLSALERPQPLWLSEGLAETYATFEMPDAERFTFGQAISDHVGLLRAKGPLPLVELLSVGRDSLQYNERQRAGIFYAESWALVHYLVFGADAPGLPSITAYLNLLQTASDPEKAFQSAFGGDYAAVGARLKKYVGGGTYVKRTYPIVKIGNEPTMQVTPAPPAEVELARGLLLFGARSPGEAEPHLRRAAELAPGDPRPWEQLGYIAIVRNDIPAARENFNRAVASGSKSPVVFFNLAVSRLPARDDPLSAFGATDTGAAEEAAANYRQAIALAPAYESAYAGLGGITYVLENVPATDVGTLSHGRVLWPNNACIEMGLGAAELRTGHGAQGRDRLERLLQRGELHPPQIARVVRSILDAETLKADTDKIDRLFNEQHFREAVEVIDAALLRDLDPPNRSAMLEARRRALGFQKIAGAVELLNGNKIAKAKAMLSEIVSSTEETKIVATQARMLLQQIEKQEKRDAR